ncbi:hypothetical protein WN944_021927 [Citrus x changshan-huyou]|uniref:Inositol oxygenase n=1 Tax=Citrus x changshan-huyou TaxID=2935761 RepID=A0AAP0MXM5_9ROSI
MAGKISSAVLLTLFIFAMVFSSILPLEAGPSTDKSRANGSNFHVAALHKSEANKHLMNEEDVENLKWLQIFCNYDLYSKSKVRIDGEKVKPYYLSLIEKYFPVKLKW